MPYDLTRVLLSTLLLCVGCTAAQDVSSIEPAEPPSKPPKIVSDEDAASKWLLPYHIILADQYRAAHRLDESIALYDQLYAAHPGSLDVILGRAKTLEALGRSDEAMAAFNKVINMTTPPLTGAYWWVWLSRLQMIDKQCDELAKTDPHAACRRGKADIYMAVRRLELIEGAPPGEVVAGFYRLKMKYKNCDPGPDPESDKGNDQD